MIHFTYVGMFVESENYTRISHIIQISCCFHEHIMLALYYTIESDRRSWSAIYINPCFRRQKHFMQFHLGYILPMFCLTVAVLICAAKVSQICRLELIIQRSIAAVLCLIKAHNQRDAIASSAKPLTCCSIFYL